MPGIKFSRDRKWRIHNLNSKFREASLKQLTFEQRWEWVKKLTIKIFGVGVLCKGPEFETCMEGSRSNKVYLDGMRWDKSDRREADRGNKR